MIRPHHPLGLPTNEACLGVWQGVKIVLVKIQKAPDRLSQAEDIISAVKDLAPAQGS